MGLAFMTTMSFETDLARLTELLGHPQYECVQGYQWMGFLSDDWRVAPTGSSLARVMAEIVPFETPRPVHVNVMLESRGGRRAYRFAWNARFYERLPDKDEVIQGMVQYHGETVGDGWVHKEFDPTVNFAREFKDGTMLLYEASSSTIWILAPSIPAWVSKRQEALG